MADEHSRGAQNVAGIIKLERDLVVVFRSFSGEVVALSEPAVDPTLSAEIHAAVGVEDTPLGRVPRAGVSSHSPNCGA